MNSKECIAMILAGGYGRRLGALMNYYSKPAIHFGGRSRLIDFTLNNCKNSGIETIGILSQHFTSDLNTYINNIHDWEPEEKGVYILTPKSEEHPYYGTANAIYRNMDFIDNQDVEDVLILAGDHIYEMDYGKLMEFHKKSKGVLTVAATTVPISEASRFGVMEVSKDNGRIYGFEEKPFLPQNNVVSMGIYLFKWCVLKKYLLMDCADIHSQHDFGRNILPSMMFHNEPVYAYQYDGYWRDVGTVTSLWEANMDQIENLLSFQLDQEKKDSCNSHEKKTPNSLYRNAMIQDSIMSANCSVFGKVRNSILSDSVTVGKKSEIVGSVLMPGVYIGNNVKIYNTIIGTRAKIMENTIIGSDSGTEYFVDNKVCSKGISLVEPWLYVDRGMEIQKNSQVYQSKMDEFHSF